MTEAVPDGLDLDVEGPADGLRTVLEVADAATTWDAESVRSRLHDDLEDAGIDHPTRPATSKLTHDQMDLLVDLLEGFHSRREFLQWQQDLVIQTVGQLEDSWYSRTAANAPTVSALLGEPWGSTEEMPVELAREVRRGIAAQDILPAFHAGHEVARWAAVERVDHLDDDGDEDEDLDPIDPRAQEYPLMRPAFGELYGQQEAALQDLLDGFERSEDLLAWSHRVTSASYAEIDRDTITAPYFETPLRERLLGTSPTEEERFIRESWACEYLLPAFNRAANALGQRAQEVTAGRAYQGDSGDGSIT
ncbi:hypothetical protein [Halobellus ordinarius]|uniref:hypothetical protein n=1 Tax=Halobellus ordinarius TaxID=3075120 RepID=UPI00288068CD|nr:hypothetical protein [Halobellus sp. ZY16]